MFKIGTAAALLSEELVFKPDMIPDCHMINQVSLHVASLTKPGEETFLLKMPEPENTLCHVCSKQLRI